MGQTALDASRSCLNVRAEGQEHDQVGPTVSSFGKKIESSSGTPLVWSSYVRFQMSGDILQAHSDDNLFSILTVDLAPAPRRCQGGSGPQWRRRARL
jgi:hypothetical protein